MAFTTTWASVTKYNLTATATNPQAYPQAEGRPGGFSLQNRINFDAITCPTIASSKANVLRILKIPPRTVINRVSLVIPPGQTTVAHAYTGSSLGASAGKSAVLNVGYINFKTLAAYQASSATSQVFDVDDLCDLSIVKKTGAIKASSALPSWSASSQSKAIKNMSDTAAPTYPHYFPYGGWVAIQVSGGASSLSKITGALSGDAHFIADCNLMPE